MSPGREPARLLRNALRANACFSALSGCTLLAFSGSLAPWLGAPDAALLTGLGLNLAVFAGLLVLLASRPVIRRGLALTVVWLDLGWVAGSAVVLLAGVLTTAGAWSVALVADVVLAFALLQYLGVRRLAPLAAQASAA